MKVKSNAEILRYVSSVSRKKAVHLAPATCAIFVQLVHFFHDNIEVFYDKEMGMDYIQYSRRDLSSILGIPLNTLNVGFQQLCKCGLIVCISPEKNFRRLDGGKVTVNRPDMTYLDLSLFVERD